MHTMRFLIHGLLCSVHTQNKWLPINVWILIFENVIFKSIQEKSIQYSVYIIKGLYQSESVFFYRVLIANNATVCLPNTYRR